MQASLLWKAELYTGFGKMRSWICDYRLIYFSKTFWIRLQAWPEKKKKRFLWLIFLWGLNITVCALSHQCNCSWKGLTQCYRHTDVEQTCSESISRKNQYSTCVSRCIFETRCHHLRRARGSVMLTVKLLLAFPQVFVKGRGNREKIRFLLLFSTHLGAANWWIIFHQLTVSYKQPSFMLSPTSVYTLQGKAGCFTERKPAEVAAKIKKTPE